MTRGSKKKASQTPDNTRTNQGAGDLLATFHKRLRDFCENHRHRDGQNGNIDLHTQTKQTVAIATEFGILIEANLSWEEFLADCPEATIGTEHMVELDTQTGLVGKTTIPPAFGLMPKVRAHQTTMLRDEVTQVRESIEFVSATPLEYLTRWIASNDVFGDDVHLVAVIRWKDQMVSFGITQPQYHGVPAESRDIESFFHAAGWTRINDPSGHVVFFNYAFGLIAIDAEKRNCYVNRGGLQPFDVILCKPNECMSRYLHLYPE